MKSPEETQLQPYFELYDGKKSLLSKMGCALSVVDQLLITGEIAGQNRLDGEVVVWMPSRIAERNIVLDTKQDHLDKIRHELQNFVVSLPSYYQGDMGDER